MDQKLQTPIPEFTHDPHFIAFRSWTAILSLKSRTLSEVRRNDAVLFLDDKSYGDAEDRIPVKAPVCFRNPSRVAHLNVTLVETRSAKKVFFARELPAGRFLHLEFLKEGSFTLYYSPAFSSITLSRNIRAFTPASTSGNPLHNFYALL